MANPLIGIGVVSCNRLRYLKALMASARFCVQYDNLEWTLIDNASVEPGIRDYINGLDFVQKKILRAERNPATEHLTAMNEIVETSQAEYLMFLPDDIQFILAGDWLSDMVELLQRQEVGSIVLDAQRRSSVIEHFGGGGSLKLGGSAKRYKMKSGREFLGYGQGKVGIAPAGICSITRREVWQQLGPWKATGDQILEDSTGGGEDGMVNRYRTSGLQLDRILPRVPVAASIFTEPQNSQAYVRNNRRYGSYPAPDPNGFYYQILGDEDYEDLQHIKPAAGFEDMVKPIGFRHEFDSDNNLIKPKKNDSDPFTLINYEESTTKKTR